MSDLKEILQGELDRRGWNAYDLADHSGVPQPTTQRFLKGTHGEPRSHTIKRWAKALNMSESALRGLSETNPSETPQDQKPLSKLSDLEQYLLQCFNHLTPEQQEKFIADLTKTVKNNQQIFEHFKSTNNTHEADTKPLSRKA